LFWLALGGLVLSGIAATGARILHEFSRPLLEEYCQRRKRLSRFGEILDHHDRVALGAECLEIIGTCFLILAGGLWMGNFGTAGLPIAWTKLLGGIAVGTFLLLVVTTWIPWAMARLWSAPFLFHTWLVWRFVALLLWPLTIGVTVVDVLMRRLAGRHEEEHDEEEAFEDEIRTIVSAGHHEGLLEADARDMIEGVIQLGDADVSQIMTPRSEVDAINATLNLREVLDFVIEVGRTRIPVYDKTLDNIIGVLFVKDLLPELCKPLEKRRRSVREIVRKPWFVTETKMVDELLREFLRTRSHLAIVLDEYQSVAGVVTIEDCLEEIVGEIVDEWDEEVEDEITIIDDKTAEALGRTQLEELNERLALDLPDPDDYDTIAGLVMERFGYIPKVGEQVVTGNVRITVLEVTRRRIEKVRLEVLQEIPRQTV
jgi:CBS domain containing-hemolysin-like protein